MCVVYMKETRNGKLIDSGFEEYETIEEAIAELERFTLTCGDFGKIEIIKNGDVVKEKVLEYDL